MDTGLHLHTPIEQLQRHLADRQPEFNVGKGTAFAMTHSLAIPKWLCK